MSDPSDEFNRVIGSFVNDTKVEEEALKNKQKQQQRHKCVKDAEAAVAMLRQHKASGESTSATPPNNTTPAQTSSTPTIAEDSTSKGEQDSLIVGDLPIPQTHQEAIEQLNRLKIMRDSLLEEKSRNDKFVSRYQEKVAKAERIATLHHLIPRQLFVREDRYNEELEKVYKWAGITDQEIAEIYQRKLGNINNNTKFKHHGAAASTRGDPYHNFRDVPDFSKAVNGKSLSSSYSSTNDVLRDLKFMKKIAGDNSNIGYYHHH